MTSLPTPARQALSGRGSVWLTYAALLGASVAWHELGHLDSHAWNILRSADSLGTLLHWVSFEGHSPAAYLLAWPMTLTATPYTMQWVGWLIGIGVVALLLRDRPLPIPIVALIASGYFLLYEYPVVPRPYLLALASSAVLASLIVRGRGGFLLRCLLCALVAMSSVFGVILSGALMLIVVAIECVYRHEGQTRPGHLPGEIATVLRALLGPDARRLLPGLALYVIVVAATAWAIIGPDQETDFEASIGSGSKLVGSSLATAVLTPVFPHVEQLPLVGRQWFAPRQAGRGLLVFGALLVYACVAWQFRHRALVALAWLSAIVLTIAVAWYSGFVAERLLGHILMLALFLYWIRPVLVPARPLPDPSSGRGKPDRRLPWSSLPLIGMLLYHAALGLATTFIEITRQATPYREAAALIEQTVAEPYELVVGYAIFNEPLMAYLDKDAFDLGCQCTTRFAEWERMNKRGRFVPMKRHWCASREPDQPVVPVIAVLEADWPYDTRGMQHLTRLPRGFAYPDDPPQDLWLWPEPDCASDTSRLHPPSN